MENQEDQSIKHKKVKNKKDPLNTFYSEQYTYEIGIDEAGRGPMLGRVYTAAVILPKDLSFNHSWMKDSKRFTSQKKIKEVAEYIKKNAISYNITYSSEEIIDTINIRQATLNSMHRSIKGCIEKSNLIREDINKILLLVDGNDFKPYMQYDNGNYTQIVNKCIEGGDNKYTAIAAASILAKVARDEYIDDLCNEYPQLIERYDILNNKGYGTKKHLDGIKQFGISAFHRRSYGICKTFI